MHKILDKFEFGPDWITVYGVICPSASKKIPFTFNQFSVFNLILFKLAGNDGLLKEFYQINICSN